MAEVRFTPDSKLLEIIEKFKEEEYCKSRSEAINRLLTNAAKRWLAMHQGAVS